MKLLIRRPAEKIAIIIFHRAVLLSLTATAYSQQKKRKENGKNKSPRKMRKSESGQSKRTALLYDPIKGPLTRKYSITYRPLAWFVSPLMNYDV
jgi:hypothetical protein